MNVRILQISMTAWVVYRRVFQGLARGGRTIARWPRGEGRGMSRARTALVLAQAIAVAATTSIGVRAARACGGFFCDRPSVTGPLPIAQAAENVLFVMDTDPVTGA